MGKKKVTILVVDDNALNREMLERRLQFHEFRTFSAENGEAGILIAKQELPDLILMDLNMGVMDGVSAVQELKVTPALKRVPIIAVSGHVLYGDKDRALAAGCDAFEPKPIQFDRLLATIHDLLKS